VINQHGGLRMKLLRITSKVGLTSNVVPSNCYTPKEAIKGLLFTAVALTDMSMLPMLADQYNSLAMLANQYNSLALPW